MSITPVEIRRKVTRILFAAVATLLPPLILRKRVTSTNTAIFILTSTALAFTERMRTEVKFVVNKAKNIRDGFIKHAPPEMNASKYLFQNENAADRVTLVGVVINLLLSIGKAVVGVTCHSSALVADAGHSLSDLFSDFITLWAVQIARLPPDDDHPYGHGKFEAVGSLFLALTLFGTGLSVGASANGKLLEILHSSAGAGAGMMKLPKWPALIMAALSITSKEWLFRITKKVGEKLNSQVVIANAWHHRSDAYSSILALASIFLAMTVPGMAAADAAAGLLVAGMICMTGAEIMGEAVKQLTDTSDKHLVERVKAVALEQSDDVLDIDRIRTRWMGSSAIVDLSITTIDNLSNSANRAIENRVRHAIMDQEASILDADVRASPSQASQTVCPLLTASEAQHNEDASVQEVENDARSLLLDCDEVKSVERCTVHYKDTVHAIVDANIKLNNAETSIEKATIVAKHLRTIMEESEHIHKANIYLDLNESAVDSAKLGTRNSAVLKP